MVRTKQTPRGGSSSHRPVGMAAARFPSTGRGKGEPKEQFKDAPGEDTEDSQDFPKVLEDADQPEEGELGTSKSEGKPMNQQHRPEKEQRPLLRKHHQTQPLLTHNPVQAKNPLKPQQKLPWKIPARPQVRI